MHSIRSSRSMPGSSCRCRVDFLLRFQLNIDDVDTDLTSRHHKRHCTRSSCSRRQSRLLLRMFPFPSLCCFQLDLQKQPQHHNCGIDVAVVVHQDSCYCIGSIDSIDPIRLLRRSFVARRQRQRSNCDVGCDIVFHQHNWRCKKTRQTIRDNNLRDHMCRHPIRFCLYIRVVWLDASNRSDMLTNIRCSRTRVTIVLQLRMFGCRLVHIQCLCCLCRRNCDFVRVIGSRLDRSASIVPTVPNQSRTRRQHCKLCVRQYQVCSRTSTREFVQCSQ